MSNTKMIPAMVATASMAFGFAQAVHAQSPVPGKPGTGISLRSPPPGKARPG